MLRQRVTRGDTSLSGVAAALGVTPHALSRRLTETGCTFQELVSEIRHETARQLLEQTSMPVGRIAELLGYTDQASFTRAFRDRAGMPPNAWRVRRRAVRAFEAEVPRLEKTLAALLGALAAELAEETA